MKRVCAFSPSGKYFTTGGEDGKVRVWEIKKKGSPTQISEINFDPDINCISYSTDSQLVNYFNHLIVKKISQSSINPGASYSKESQFDS